MTAPATDLRKAPYLALDAGGQPLGARIVACEMSGALEAPRTVAVVDCDDPYGDVRTAAAKGTAVQLRGGRRGGAEATLLTGTVAKDPLRLPGNRRTVRLTVADGWAAADAKKVTADAKQMTPQDMLELLLNFAGIADYRLSTQAFKPERRAAMMDEWSLAKGVKEVSGMWALDNSDLEFDQAVAAARGEAPPRKWHWVAGFEGAGTFFWENWPDGPQAQAEPLALGEGDLIRLEREQTTDGEKGRMECFFEPRLVPGLRVDVAGVPGRIEERRHRYDGGTFRTEAVYGPVPG